jgi:hypothetical protein
MFHFLKKESLIIKKRLFLKNNLFQKKSISTLEKNDFLVISDEIKYSNKPVVALESIF